MKPFILPVLAGAASTAAAWRWAIYPPLVDPSAVTGFGGTIASISTTMLGFVLASLAVLASITHTHLVKQMQVYGHYGDLLRTMLFACLIFLACAVCGFALLFGARPCAWFLALVVGLHMSALIALVDVGRKLWFVLINLRAS